ncbi:YunG family protein [Ilumatobacter sp.]|uniref:YunG family protein n=1 Tax=Ilumatobacter sp. TaxID=1967498 RepID=UPI003C6EE55A
MRGQCAVTAKVVQDYLGGTLLIAPVLKNGEPVAAHCWNVLPDGAHVALTADQFGGPFELGDAVERERVVDHTGVNRHHLLAERVRRKLPTDVAD